MHSESSSASKRRSRYVLGLGFLSLVVLLWVSSSILTQKIFRGMNFSAPFFVTYFNTLVFVVYLIPEIARFAVFKYKEWKRKRYDQTNVEVSNVAVGITSC